MATKQKKWLTQPNGKLAKADIVAALRKDEAWSTLSKEKREELYAMLPPPREDEAPWNVDINPLNTRLGPYLEDEILIYQQDLKDGKETKKWRNDALQATQARRDEGWDEIRKKQRQADRAKRDAARAAGAEAKKNGGGETTKKDHDDEDGKDELAVDGKAEDDD